MPSSLGDAMAIEACSWLGTPFVLGACVKGVGVDCVQLARGVGLNVGVIPWDFPDFLPYPSGWLLDRTDTRYHDELAKYLDLIWTLDSGLPMPTPEPGDVLLYRVGRAPAHSAIVTLWPQVIHAGEDCVVGANAGTNVLGERSRPLISIWRVRGLCG